MMSVGVIAAVATPPGMGAIAVVRLSGEGAGRVAGRIFSGRWRAEEAPARRAVLGRIVDGAGRVVDEVLLTRFAAPASFTGEEVVEISCHGGPVVAGEILRLALEAGARLAEPGEFTLRAFLNGKLDLAQAEAVMDIISAKTPLALRAANEQLRGRLGEELGAAREVLLEAVAHLEAWIDFPEEGLGPEVVDGLLAAVGRARETLARLLDTARPGRILRDGARLVVWGCPNAGKSSLLNALVGFERAIVSEVPGTTRDTIEEFVSLGGWPFRVVDTAGLRNAGDVVEGMGVERARRAMAEADVLLEVVDGVTGERAEPCGEGGAEVPRLVAWNKMDVPGAMRPPEGHGVFAISCRTGEGMRELVQGLVAAVQGAGGAGGVVSGDGEFSCAVINARHQACLSRASAHLEEAAAGLARGLEPELVAVDLRAALDAIGEVTGSADAEEILGAIFGRFCIGK